MAAVVASVASDSGSSGLSVARPTGVTNGDLLIAVHASDWGSFAGNGLPSGFTALTTSDYDGGTDNGHVQIGYRIASGEPASYSFSQDGADSVAAVLRITGADSTPLIAQTAPITTNNGETAPSIVPNGTDDLMITINVRESFGGAGTWTAASGMTVVLDATSNGQWAHTLICSLQSPSNPSGTKAATWSGGGPASVFGGCSISIASAAGSVPNDGAVSGSVSRTGAAAGQREPLGSASGSQSHAGSSAGSTTRKGNAAGTASLTGAATGQREPVGSASGTTTWTGTATGETPLVVQSGSASGTVTRTGSATGVNHPQGAATGTHSRAGSATGATDPQGSTSGTTTRTGSATGATVPKGAASGSVSRAGSVSGETPQAKAGAVTGSVSRVGVATGFISVSGSVSSTVSRTGTASGGKPLFRFEPPTHEEPMRTDVRPLCYYRLTWANSVVKVNGTFTSMRSIPAELQVGLTEGVDYFLGGRIYDVDDDVRAELIASGYSVQ